ncbi:MAG TPA: UDP-N-acetylmuramoyl-L-alanyl-D-glutamate--2,6-diaminopimelate ligase [Acidobacteriaceae bacterium]|nr:UDP-N-acetylmuramoyl-L-alanyl-D-glutamate--2,6-diaminopimelate ligase [Acidobacteriaceae bacterium]
MQWHDAVTTLATSGRPGIPLRDVQYDSRRVHAGDAFVAMQGGSADGNRFIDKALQSGAAAILTDSAEVFARLKQQQPELALALVANGRRALAELTAALYGHPEQRLALSAVTGTNGKTTTTFLLEQLLQSVGRKNILIGTVETHVAGEVLPSEHTTPESRDILALFRDGLAKGCTEAIMEMSSHALAQERVWGLPVDVAIFTNLTQDHLDFHTTMEDYAAAKARLFAGVGAPPPRVAVVNQDAPYAADMVHAFTGQVLMTYSTAGYGTHRAENLRLGLGDTRFTFATPGGSVAIRSPLSGQVNVENLLAAMCAALARGLTLDRIAAATQTLRQVPGRFEVVPGSHEAGFTVVVDYAHTEDALRNLLRLARDTVGPGVPGSSGRGRVITLFGCGGDRDRTKRPRMGQAAGEGSDLVILTSDNPRTEDPQAILDEAEAGLRPTGTAYRVEPDRRAAIALAVEQAHPGDIVLLAGKGHEKTQTTAAGSQPFDDVAEAAEALRHLRAVGK